MNDREELNYLREYKKMVDKNIHLLSKNMQDKLVKECPSLYKNVITPNSRIDTHRLGRCKSIINIK